ncbi:hypothetical protein [Ramlibacter albus]|uniref:Uncharacterized protein n=1 Tax=Ramlibacter albus TaxID=2079448 RepID=A0A923MA62_9BURK|nr:hypothetical protein [Ramlibacter albus]MBC5766860.1 hypothetical protein [Ramlibacter albus]
MNAPLGGAGPEPFRFQPSQGPSMQGPAFSPFFKALITVVVFGCIGWGLNLWWTGKVASQGTLTAWFAAGLLLMLYTWFCVMRGVTSIGQGMLRQSWIWEKRMEIGELAFGKLIRVRGLEWLVAPRLYVRTLTGKFAVFYVSDRAMLAECERLVNELREFRRF